jgi:predicted RNase H-like HicB family nuclease
MADPRVFTAVFVPSDGWWAAKVEEVPGVNSQGRTLEEARANLRDALSQMLEILREDAAEFELRDGAVKESLFLEAS